MEMIKESKEIINIIAENKYGSEIYTQGNNYTVKKVKKCKISDGIIVTKIPEKGTVMICGMYLESVKRFLESRNILYVVLAIGEIENLFLFLNSYKENEEKIKKEMYWSLD